MDGQLKITENAEVTQEADLDWSVRGGDSISSTIDNPAPTAEEVAIDKIEAYVDDQTQPTPTVQDYIDANVTGVTAVNLDDINNAIAKKTSSEVDTTAEIQVVINNVSSSTQWDASNWDELIWQ
jgi:hypothetical protein